MPSLSVIIPTFRRPTELEEALGSVLAQEVPLEVLVVDDSREGSAAVVVGAIADSRVTYLQMPAPTGGVPGRVRNFGLAHATGAVVHFLDDDDVVPRGHYARALRCFDQEPGLGVLFGRVAPFGGDLRELEREHDYFARAARSARCLQRLGTRSAFAACQSFLSTLLVCSAGLARRRCIDAIGGFDGELSIVEDVDYYARLFQRFEVRYLDELALHYRIGPSLMRAPGADAAVQKSYAHMHARYRSELGAARFLALRASALLARSLLLSQ